MTKVSHSAWAAPVVVVPKADGGIRFCGDFKVTVNQVLDVDKYPLPNPQDLLSALAGGKRFTKLDLKHACQQLPLSEESKQFLTINTSKVRVSISTSVFHLVWQVLLPYSNQRGTPSSRVSMRLCVT